MREVCDDRMRNRVYSGPGYLEIPGNDGVIWEADLRPGYVLPLSTSSNAAQLRAALAAMGLTLTRASAATVQTSASTVVTSGIGVDDPRVGLYGLVIEEARTNDNPNSSPSAWSPSSLSLSATTGPGEETAGLLEDANAGAVGYAVGSYTQTTTTSYACSVWLSDVSGAAGTVQGTNWNGPVINPRYARPVTAGWQRMVSIGTSSATAATSCVLLPAADTASHVGAFKAALVQAERGKFATEAIITTGAAATRATDVVTLDSPSRLIRSGQVSLEFAFRPKFARTETGNVYLAVGGTDYIAISNAGAVMARVNGVSIISNESIGTAGTWAQGSLVEVAIEMGNGAPRARSRTNGGAVMTHTFPAGSHGAVTLAASPQLFGLSGTSVCTAWHQRARAYALGRRPAWAA